MGEVHIFIYLPSCSIKALNYTHVVLFPYLYLSSYSLTSLSLFVYILSLTGGLQQIVLPGINSTSINIKQEAFHLLGSAVQSNPRVQIAAVELGLVESLIRAVAYETEVQITGNMV